MKKSTLIILTILGVGMIAAGVLVSHLFDESYTTSGDYAVLGDYPAAEITEVRVRLQGLSLSVYEHNDRKQLEAAGYGRAVNDVEIRLEDGVLFLTENGGFSSLPTNRDESVTLWMPRHFEGLLTLSTDSGEISLNGVGMTGMSASLTTDSGEVSLYGCEFDDLQVRSDSGEIWGNSLAVDRAAFSSDSGEIRLGNEGVDGREVALTTVSGDVSVTGGETETLSIQTGSGDVWINETAAALLAVRTDSGEVYLSAGECGEVSVETDSGSVHSDALRTDRLAIHTDSGDIGGSVSGRSGEPEVEITTNSGDTFLDY